MGWKKKKKFAARIETRLSTYCCGLRSAKQTSKQQSWSWRHGPYEVGGERSARYVAPDLSWERERRTYVWQKHEHLVRGGKDKYLPGTAVLSTWYRYDRNVNIYRYIYTPEYTVHTYVPGTRRDNMIYYAHYLVFNEVRIIEYLVPINTYHLPQVVVVVVFSH